jgi:hypothetical protein
VSVKAVETVLKKYVGPYSDGKKLKVGADSRRIVLLVLAWRVNNDDECWPGNVSLAKECGFWSPDRLKTTLRSLRYDGLVEYQHAGRGRGVRARLKLHLERLPSEKGVAGNPFSGDENSENSDEKGRLAASKRGGWPRRKGAASSVFEPSPPYRKDSERHRKTLNTQTAARAAVNVSYFVSPFRNVDSRTSQVGPATKPCQSQSPVPTSTLKPKPKPAAIVEETFQYYLHEAVVDPKTYTLTPKRRANAKERYREALKMCGGDADEARALLKKVVDRVVARRSDEFVINTGQLYNWDKAFSTPESFQNHID